MRPRRTKDVVVVVSAQKEEDNISLSSNNPDVNLALKYHQGAWWWQDSYGIWFGPYHSRDTATSAGRQYLASLKATSNAN